MYYVMTEERPEANTMPDSSVQETTGRTNEGLPRMVNSGDLLAGKRELLIHHRGDIYRLLLTRNGKLILQK